MQKKPAFNTSKPHLNAQGLQREPPLRCRHHMKQVPHPPASIWAKFV